MPAILGLGLPWNHPSIPEHFTDQTIVPELVRAGLERIEQTLIGMGYDYRFLPVTPEEGVGPLKALLESKHYDELIIGFGVRGNPKHTKLFEDVINTAATVTPGIKIAFNTPDTADSTIDAAVRYFPLSKGQ